MDAKQTKSATLGYGKSIGLSAGIVQVHLDKLKAVRTA